LTVADICDTMIKNNIFCQNLYLLLYVQKNEHRVWYNKEKIKGVVL